MTAPAVRTRRRVNTERDVELTPPHKEWGEKYFRANKIKNAATNAEKKAREETLKAMVVQKVTKFDMTLAVNPERPQDGTVVLDFEIDDSDGEEIDMVALYNMVSAGRITIGDFVSVCKSSKGALVDKFGSLIYAEVSKPKPRDASVSYTIRK